MSSREEAPGRMLEPERADGVTGDLVEVVVEPHRNMKNYWRDLRQYRELFFFLAWRDIAVRYKQTVLGVAWTVIRPLLTMIVFTVIFNRLAHLTSPDGVPYTLLVFSGLLPWMFFTTALVETSNSMVDNVNLISKVYFPRIILPTSAVMVAMADFLISLALLVGLMIVLRFLPSVRLLTLPLFLLLAACATLGAGLWLASLNVKYRDFRYVIPFIVQLGTYVSPVGFSSSIVPQQWRVFYALNPMVGVIDGFRWAILGHSTPLPAEDILASSAVAVALLLSGLWYFHRMERTFADVI